MFTTLEFWLFVLITLVLYYAAPTKFQNIVLLVSSYLFYAYFDLRFLLLLWLATGSTFAVARALDKDNLHRRRYLAFGLLFNIGILAFFKLANFFVSSFASRTDPIVATIILPFGISFYSFRLISYLLDVYNQRLKSELSPMRFALYVAFFAQIASGPIERAGPFLTALHQRRKFSQDQFASGLIHILVGLYYKFALANYLAPQTDKFFGGLNTLTSANALLALVIYSIQLYADFAGYSAMAIGVSKWFGLPARENFRQPYFAQSVTEFWTRWHISLSTWFRDYFFYPLSRSLLKRFGSSHALAVQAVSYLATMFVTGLWHGVSFNFVIWGLLFGLYMSLESVITRHAKQPELESWQQHFNRVGNILLTVFAVAITWVFFRMDTTSDAILFLQKLFQPILIAAPTWWVMLLTPIVLMLIIDLLQLYLIPIERFWTLRLGVRAALVTGLLTLIIIFGGQALAPFVYFKF